ncbi:MAG: MgtC/SapB family protein [Candidatus Paceibacterota bacterium]|jgi:putative Mg2+ transporter-C (MgtC) family protein
MDFLNSAAIDSNIEIFIKLSLALFFGATLGLERIFAHRTAGPRTYALVSMGSALLIIVSELVIKNYQIATGTFFDPLRVASNIVVGIGFLGTGIIVFKDSTPVGITTAAGLWLAAGIGMAIGFGLYLPAFIATILTLFIFTILFNIEESLLRVHDGKPPHPHR